MSDKTNAIDLPLEALQKVRDLLTPHGVQITGVRRAGFKSDAIYLGSNNPPPVVLTLELELPLRRRDESDEEFNQLGRAGS